MTETEKNDLNARRARAFGLMTGLAEGLTLRLPREERAKVEAIIAEASKLWEQTEEA